MIINTTSTFTIVIPTRNESATIAEMVDCCRKLTPHVLVVDSLSTDGTPEIATKAGAKVIALPVLGKGAAIRAVIPHIETAIVVFIDADGSHVVEDIPLLLKPIMEDQADHVQASRLMGGSSELHGSFQEFFRLAGSALITACINWRFKVAISESQNGFRALKLDLLKQLDLQENITTIEQEMVIKTLKKGYRLSEVPSHEHARIFGDSKIKLSKVWFRYGYVLIKELLIP
ncbi:MAG: glycosyltransferase family 2 protein [Magnetococcales bacterium]|nr:glycosyltransferase family 2 protein [Magnetococcales bacterium]MBF0439096.1 glycosyltransferase family 2 protein [Magnetococcales bacterium]